MSDRKLPRLRLLWDFARPYKVTLLLGLTLALAASAMGLATPMVTKWVLDSLSAATSLRDPIIGLIVLLLVGTAVSLWQWILLGTVGQRVVLDTRVTLVRRVFSAIVPRVTARPPGELVTRITNDTTLLSEAAGSLVGLINGAVMLVGSLVLMGLLDTVLLGTTVGALGVCGGLFAALMPLIAKSQTASQDHIGQFGGALEAAVRAIKTVKVSRAEKRQGDAIVASASESARYGIKAVRTEAVAWTISWSGMQVAIIIILGVGAWRVSEGLLEVSSLIAFLLYAFGLMDPITELSQNTTALQSGIAAAGRIGEVTRIESETESDGGEVAARHHDPVLELRGVTASYGPKKEPAVRGVDLAIPRYGHTAIVGPSGAGKTTLFSLMLRFLEPQNGEIRLRGVPYRDCGHSQLRGEIAYVEQETPTVPGSVRDNLALTHPDVSEEEMRAALRAVHLEDMVDALPDGVDTALNSAHISGGQRQRLSMARAMIRTPRLLLLDEATAQVDGITEGAIAECVRHRARQGAVVTVAHRLSTVIDADTIVVMDEGRVRARGTHTELLARDELYAQLVTALRIEQQPTAV